MKCLYLNDGDNSLNRVLERKVFRYNIVTNKSRLTFKVLGRWCSVRYASSSPFWLLKLKTFFRRSLCRRRRGKSIYSRFMYISWPLPILRCIDSCPIIFVAPFLALDLNVNVTLQHLNWFKRIHACPAIVQEFLIVARVVSEDLKAYTPTGH